MAAPDAPNDTPHILSGNAKIGKKHSWLHLLWIPLFVFTVVTGYTLTHIPSHELYILELPKCEHTIPLPANEEHPNATSALIDLATFHRTRDHVISTMMKDETNWRRDIEINKRAIYIY